MFQDYLKNHQRLNLNSNWLSQWTKDTLTLLLVPYERRRVRSILELTANVNLHLGCGNTYLSKWINIDMARPGRKLDLRWDLRRGIPFPDNCATAVFSEHLFEHIDLQGSLSLMKESLRVLMPGGLLRIAVPDLERYVLSYMDKDSIIEDVRPDRPTKSVAINEVFYFHGHRTMYDWELMKSLLETAGFSRVVRSSFGQSSLDPSPDGANRRAESLYVEAFK